MSLGRPARVFLSYSHRDHRFVQGLVENLATLKRARLVEQIWWDGDIDAGADWRKEVFDHLEKADAILLLLSPHFVASDFCVEIELRRALERREAGTLVVPVVLRKVELRDLGLSALEAIPGPDKPIDSGRLTDGFRLVTERFRQALDDLGTSPALTNAGTRPAAALAAPDLALLPHLCDRRLQLAPIEMQLPAQIRVEPRHPIVIVVPGDSKECHTEFVDRLERFELPDLLCSRNPDCITKRAIVDLHQLREVSEIWYRLDNAWPAAERAADKTQDHISAHMRGVVAAHPRHLLFVSHFYSRDLNRIKLALPMIFEFWSGQWRDVKLDRVPIHCLCLQYEYGTPEMPDAIRTERDRQARALNRFVHRIDLGTYAGIHGIKLEPLSPVEWSDVKEWTRREEVAKQCCIPEPSIEELERRLRAPKPPMRELAPQLVELARQYLQSARRSQ